jgi:hypothetical protein
MGIENKFSRIVILSIKQYRVTIFTGNSNTVRSVYFRTGHAEVAGKLSISDCDGCLGIPVGGSICIAYSTGNSKFPNH